MNCAFSLLLPYFLCGHDTSCPYATALFTFWVAITMYNRVTLNITYYLSATLSMSVRGIAEK